MRLHLAVILTAFHERLREPNLTFNPSVIVGGTDVQYDTDVATGSAGGKTNVVPRTVIVEGDLRFLTREQLEHARTRMRAIAAESLPRTTASLTFTDGMPAMEPTAANRDLLGVLDRVSRDIGAGPVEAHDPALRGAGDISFVAALVPGLDGLGAVGGHVHAPGEYMDLESLPVLTKRAALLMHRLRE